MPVQAVYIDVDLTLVDADGKVYPGVEATLQRYRRMYSTMVCWSHSSGEYAKRMCIDNKIDKYFDYFLSKPDIMIDDSPEFIMDYAHVLRVDDKRWWLDAMSKLYGKEVKARTKPQPEIAGKRRRKKNV